MPKGLPVRNRSRRNRHLLVMSPDLNGGQNTQALSWVRRTQTRFQYPEHPPRLERTGDTPRPCRQSPRVDNGNLSNAANQLECL